MGIRLPGFFLYLKLILTAVFWGGTFVAGRIIALEMQPFSAAFLRFVVASMFLLAFVFRSHGKMPLLERGQILPVFMLGLTGVFAYNAFFFSGLKTITASRASLIVATNPALITLFSSICFRERLGRLKIQGVILSLIGAAIVISRGHPLEILRGNLGLGELYIFGCVASWVSYSLIGKVAMRRLSPLVTVTYACIIGMACLFFPALFEGVAGDLSSYSPAVWLAILYLGFFGSALGFSWYYEGIKVIGPSRAGIFINIVPISSILLAFLILHESIDASLVAGVILVSTGIYMTNKTSGRSDPK